MKKIIITLLLSCTPLLAQAECGYWCQDQRQKDMNTMLEYQMRSLRMQERRFQSEENHRQQRRTPSYVLPQVTLPYGQRPAPQVRYPY